jgi:hypothetical protein
MKNRNLGLLEDRLYSQWEKYKKKILRHSVMVTDRWIEFEGKKYFCRKIGNREWTVEEVDDFPFSKSPLNKI